MHQVSQQNPLILLELLRLMMRTHCQMLSRHEMGMVLAHIRATIRTGLYLPCFRLELGVV